MTLAEIDTSYLDAALEADDPELYNPDWRISDEAHGLLARAFDDDPRLAVLDDGQALRLTATLRDLYGQVPGVTARRLHTRSDQLYQVVVLGETFEEVAQNFDLARATSARGSLETMLKAILKHHPPEEMAELLEVALFAQPNLTLIEGELEDELESTEVIEAVEADNDEDDDETLAAAEVAALLDMAAELGQIATAVVDGEYELDDEFEFDEDDEDIVDELELATDAEPPTITETPVSVGFTTMSDTVRTAARRPAAPKQPDPPAKKPTIDELKYYGSSNGNASDSRSSRPAEEDNEDRVWQDFSNCLGVDPDLFFPERGASTKEAKEVCRGCVVREECLEYALATGEKFGIWGGMSERERRRIRRQRALARAAASQS